MTPTTWAGAGHRARAFTLSRIYVRSMTAAWDTINAAPEMA